MSQNQSTQAFLSPSNTVVSDLAKLESKESMVRSLDDIESIKTSNRRRKLWSNLVKTRTRKCILCSIISFIIILIIFIPLTLFVIAPSVAQSSIANSKLVIHNLDITDPKMDSFLLSMNATMSDTGSFDALMKESNMEMLFKDKSFGLFPMPAVYIEAGKSTALLFSARVKITDEQVYLQFSRETINRKDVSSSMKGKISVTVMTPIKASLTLNDIPFEKSMTLNGMDGLKEMEILEINLPKDLSDGIQLEVDARMKNRSPMSMIMGDTYFNVFYQGILTARMTSKDLKMKKGWNKVKMTGQLLPISKENEQIMSKFFSDSMNGIDSNLVVKGVSTDYHGKQIPWLNKTINNLSLSSLAPGMKNFNPISGMEIIEMSIEFVKNDPTLMRVMTKIKTSYLLPPTYKFSTNLKYIDQKMNMITKDGIPYASLKLQSESCNDQGHSVVASLVGDMRINVPNKRYFDEFLENQMKEKSVDFRFTGLSTVHMNTKIGNMIVKDVPLSDTKQMDGMDISNQNPLIGEMIMTKGTAEKLFIDTTVKMTNPASVTVSGIGDVNFNLFFNYSNVQVQMGRIKIVNFNMAKGMNQLKVVTELWAGKEDDFQFQPAKKQFFSNFALGLKSDVVLKGYNESSTVFAVKNALSKIEMPSFVPGQIMEITKKSYSFVCLSRARLYASFDLANPFDVPLRLNEIINMEISSPKVKFLNVKIQNQLIRNVFIYPRQVA
ncbi:hypothetical protein ROZALSC1DRAFT_31172, partial [Rozella allomycis CSF55]